jgi:diguanylate cyclase (GGDEF)-like protein/PAS domain S-box-containing protein
VRIGQSAINAGAAMLLGLLFAFLIVGSSALRASSRKAAAAAAAESATHLLGDEINRASDYLTDQARAFVATGDRASLDSYWTELSSTRGRERAFDEASRLRLPDDETAALRRAKEESDELVAVEAHAMRLVADALGYPEAELPRPLADARPTSAERSLSAPGKMSLARELVLGAEQWERKRAIRKAVEDFQALSQARTASAARATQEAADRNLVLVNALCALAVVVMAFLMVLYYRLVALPIRHYIRTMRIDEPEVNYPELRPEGALELAVLAETINMRRGQRIRMERALRDSELRLRTNLLMMPLAAMEVDEANRIRSWNPAAELMFGYLEKEVLGREVVDLIVPERLRDEIRGLLGKLALGEVIDRHVNENVTKDGQAIVCEWYNTPLYDSKGAWIGWVSLIRDITEQQAEAERTLYLSRHDPLTGLLNRRSMWEKLREEWLRSARTGSAYSAIMLDIDKFKDFNDSYGHECGDVVLRRVADSMADAVRATDSVARWGGEEFLVLLPETGAEGGMELAEKIRSRIEAEEIDYRGALFRVTVTAGIATAKAGDKSADDCVRRADEALLSGKAGGRNKVVAAP